jgi:hypothetical protein
VTLLARDLGANQSDAFCDPCNRDLESVCPPRPLLSEVDFATRGSARLSLWEENIVFADSGRAQVRVPADELDQLWGDFDQCRARYGDWGSLPGIFPEGEVSGI